MNAVTVGAWMASPGTIHDTTADPQWTPLRVTARFSQPIVGIPKDPMHLDGPLQWAAYLAATEQGLALPPIGRWAHDFTMPVATWTAPCTRPDPDPRLLAADGVSVWGWACSAASYRVLRHDVAHVRRKPALEAMALWTGASRHHIGLGPRRAANTPHQAAWVDAITWWCLGDLDGLRLLLARLTNVGRLARHGWGHILDIEVAPDPQAVTRWKGRTFPEPGGRLLAVRAPYWHESRRMPCSLTRLD